MRIGTWSTRNAILTILFFLLFSLLSCIAQAPPSQPPTAPSSPTPTVSTPTESASWFKPELYTGIPSPDCKPPITDVTSLPKAHLKITVDAQKLAGNLNHDLWMNFRHGSLYQTAATERNQPFWELMRYTRALQSARCDDYFSDGFPIFQVKNLKAFLADCKIPTDQSGKPEPTFNYWGCRIYSEDANGNPKYNFWHLDQVLDTYLSAGIRPEFEVDYMPDALASGNKVRNYGGGLVNAPVDYSKWHDLIYATAKHCIERYGLDEVRRWHWNIWNEPDNDCYCMVGVSRGSSNRPVPAKQEDVDLLLKMYDYFADAVKAADSQLKVGGPGVTMTAEFGQNCDWFTPFLSHCVNGKNYATGGTGSPLDFISWHGFNYLSRMMSENQIYLKLIAKFPSLNRCKTFIDEWAQPLLIINERGERIKNERGESIDNRNSPEVYNNYEAAYICAFIDGVISRSENEIDRFYRNGNPTNATGVYKCFSFTYEKTFRPMPILNTYILLAKMGTDMVEIRGSSFGDDIHGFATKTDDGVQALIYNFNEADRKSQGSTKEIDLTVTGLEKTWVKMKRYQIDSKNSNVWANWPVLASVATMEQLRQMEDDSKLKVIEKTDSLATKEGQLTFRLNLPANSVSLVVIGEEASPLPLGSNPHIARVLREESAYKSARAKLDNKDLAGAKAAFEKLASDSFANVPDTTSKNPYCFWGQKALYALLDIEKRQGNTGAADRIRKRLLDTTLGDIELFALLNERIKYLETVADRSELTSVSKDMSAILTRLEYFANWSVWTPIQSGWESLVR